MARFLCPVKAEGIPLLRNHCVRTVGGIDLAWASLFDSHRSQSLQLYAGFFGLVKPAENFLFPSVLTTD